MGAVPVSKREPFVQLSRWGEIMICLCPHSCLRRLLTRTLLVLAVGLPVLAAGAEEAPHDQARTGAHDQAHDANHDQDPGAEHGHEGHSHAGPLHFSHPLIAESPSPDTKIRLDGFTFDGDEGSDQLRLEAEYAFHPSFSIELDVPWTSLDDEEGGSTSGLDNIGLGLKFANFAFADKGLLLSYGIEFGLPTGDDAKGIGSDNVFEIEPFLALGVLRGRFELVSFFEFGIPTNQDEEEGQEVETEMGANLSLLYHASRRIQLLVELDGETVLSGEEEGESVVNVTPGLKVRPVADSPLWLGLGLGTPISSNEEFDTRVVGSLFYHF